MSARAEAAVATRVAWRGALRVRGRDVPVAVAVCSLLAALFAAGVWAHPATRWLGYAGDPQQATWFLRWTPYAIAHGQNPLLTDHIGYPGGVNLMWNTSMALLGVVLAPITLTAGPVVAYNVAVVMAFALSGVAAYALLRRLVGPGVAALLGALFYEFSPYTVAHALGQLDLTLVAGPPLMLLLIHEVLVRRRWSARRAGVLLGLVAAGQALVAEELLASSAIAAVVVLVVLAVQDGSATPARSRDGLRALGWALLVFAPLMVLPLWVQLAGPQSLRGSVQPSGFFVSDLLGLAVPTQSQLLAPQAAIDFTQRFSGNPVEWSAYLGLPLLALLAFAAVRWWRDVRVRTATICGGVFLVLSLGPSLHAGGHDTGIPLPWAVLDRVPLLDNILPGRMTLYVDLCVAVVLAITVQNVRRVPALVMGRRAALALGAVGVSILPALPLPTDSVPVPPFFTSDAAQRLPSSGSVLVAPFTSDFTAVAPMAWQASAGMAYRMPGGYAMIPDASGRAHQGPPPTALSDALQGIAAGRGAPVLSPSVLARMRDDMRHWDVRAALVGPMPHRTEATAFLTALLGCAPEAVDGVDVWEHAGAGGCA
ncbi:MAG TPA: hypothetical protein VN193_01825 [Candidatus Angelobacter sp.]|jgi:hypothetical protein|nr:hypothetical protein [Candidatus Angelobacter sp.]